MNTDYLKEFVVFAGHLNFTTAAKALRMSQPTLSRHVSELERYYECDLVDRTSSPLRLTHCGRTLLGQAPELIAHEETVDAHMARAKLEPYGNLVIQRYRKSPRVRSVLADLESRLRQTHPGFSISKSLIRLGDTATGALKRGYIDLGITSCTCDTQTVDPPSEKGLSFHEIPNASEKILFVVSSASPLAAHSRLSLEQLRDSCFIFPLNPEFDRCLPDITALFASRGLRLRSKPHELNDVDDLGLITLGPDDVFIIVESAAETPDGFCLNNPGIVIVPCSDDITVTRYAAYRTGDCNPVLSTFLKALE